MDKDVFPGGEIRNVSVAAQAYLIKHYRWHLIFSGLFAIVFTLALAKWGDFWIRGDYYRLLVPIFIFLTMFLGFYRFAYLKARHEFLRQFAASIGFGYSRNGDAGSIKGHFAKVGHSRSMEDVISGVYNDLPTKIFDYFFSVGEGKSRRNYWYTVFEITFHSKLPEIFLNSRSFPGMSHDVSEGRYLALEGDFNKHFSLYVEKEYELEACQILTPDVMAELIDHAKNFNFELLDDKLYIYTGKHAETVEEMRDIFGLAKFLSGLFAKAAPNIHIYRSEEIKNDPPGLR